MPRIHGEDPMCCPLLGVKMNVLKGSQYAVFLSIFGLVGCDWLSAFPHEHDEQAHSACDEENNDGTYKYPDHMSQLTNYVQSLNSDVNEFSGTIEVIDGKLTDTEITVLHSRSIAEDIVIKDGNNLYSGELNISQGKITEAVVVEGKSLVSSAELTAKAFSQGTFGEYGGKLVAISLLLFAFSTAITWCYYGDRSTAYIFGEKAVFWYRNFYVLCFVLAAVIDTTIVWNIAYVSVALVSIPNLIALFFLRKEVKELSDDYKV